MRKISILLWSIILLFSISSCEKPTNTYYESNFIAENDTLIWVEKDSLKNYPNQKKLHIYTSILSNNGKIYKTILYYRLSNENGESIAEVRIVEDDSTQFVDKMQNKKHIVFEGDIAKISSDFDEIVKKINSISRDEIQRLKEKGEKKVIDLSTGDDVKEAINEEK